MSLNDLRDSQASGSINTRPHSPIDNQLSRLRIQAKESTVLASRLRDRVGRILQPAPANKPSGEVSAAQSCDLEGELSEIADTFERTNAALVELCEYIRL